MPRWVTGPLVGWFNGLGALVGAANQPGHSNGLFVNDTVTRVKIEFTVYMM